MFVTTAATLCSPFKVFFFFLTGYCISKRRQRRGTIGASHRINKEESMKWFQQKVCGVTSIFTYFSLK